MPVSPSGRVREVRLPQKLRKSPPTLSSPSGRVTEVRLSHQLRNVFPMPVTPSPTTAVRMAGR